MSRPRTKVRWTDADRAVLRKMWPERHEVDVWQALDQRYTLIAVRSQVRLLGLRKSPEYRHFCRRSLAVRELYESRERIQQLEEYIQKLERFNGVERIRELETAVKILRARLRQFERLSGG